MLHIDSMQRFNATLFRRFRLIMQWLCLTVAIGAASVSYAIIPATERAALQALYTSTNGASWAVNTNWNGAVGTECTWFGVTCSSGDANVTRIDLNTNGLTGSLAPLAALTALERFNVNDNLLTGNVPALASLSALEFFEAKNNNLTGAIPALAGLANLLLLNLSGNSLTSAIPALTGLPGLLFLIVNNNALTGSIPTLTGSPLLSIVDVSQNNLSGSIPSLTGLTSLATFRVGSNQLTGAIPALTGLNSLKDFSAQGNQLTGSIPALNGSTTLQRVQLYNNQLSGPIPSLTGLIFLNSFLAYGNQLSGSIPTLTGLTNLTEFDVSNNALTGSIPSLTGTDLDIFRVANNQLTGAVPAAPATLNAGESTLCPNQLTPSVSPAWDTATGQTPWSFLCGGSGGSYTVTPSASANGTISPSTPQTVASGATTSFIVSPNPGYFGTVSSTCGGSFAPEPTYVTNPIVANCTVIANFAPSAANFTVTPSVIGGNGSISPSTPQTVASGATIAFTLSPYPGYILANLQGTCGGTLNGNLFTSDPIAADCTVGAVFAPDRNAQAITVPTLGSWSLALLGALAALLGVARVGASRRPSLLHRHRN
jgi:Leucine-rich repeat (LRR) protein